MPVQIDGKAPYAPLTAIKAVIERHRSNGLPQQITLDVLVRMSITESLAPRTLQALRLLDLVTDEGTATPEFELIRRASEPELPHRLSELIRSVYAPVFEIIDPTTATVAQLGDAFRGFTPPGQRERMVALFTGLMGYAGMIEGAPLPAKRIIRTSVSNSKLTVGQRAAGKLNANRQTPPTLPPAPANGRSQTRTVALRSGGSLTLALDLNLLELSDEDTVFVLNLQKQLREYAAADLPSPAGGAGSPDSGGNSS